ncbi:MAG: hypothetical protein IJH68_10215 [Thermoguttaceae bacterium]|nr:hypothetical protein [Thermoguttaceae bacterium]
MDQKKNDSKKDKPFVHYAAGCALAGLFVVAAVWLFLLLDCFLRFFLGVGTIFHNPWVLALYAGEATVLCAAFGVPLLVIWEICHSRIQKKEQDRKNSQTDPSDPQICPPQELGGQSQEVPKTGSTFVDLTYVRSGCLPVLSIVALIPLLICLISVLFFPSLTGPLPFCLMGFIPLFVLWRLFYHRNERRGHDENHPKSASLINFIIDFALAVGLLFLIAMELAFFNIHV